MELVAVNELKGYTVILFDKYILCGAAQNTHWAEIDKLNNGKVRQYPNLKTLFNNLWYHMHTYGSRDFQSELDNIMYEHGWVVKTYWGASNCPDYKNKEALKYLIEHNILKVVKVHQVLFYEEAEKALEVLK